MLCLLDKTCRSYASSPSSITGCSGCSLSFITQVLLRRELLFPVSVCGQLSGTEAQALPRERAFLLPHVHQLTSNSHFLTQDSGSDGGKPVCVGDTTTSPAGVQVTGPRTSVHSRGSIFSLVPGLLGMCVLGGAPGVGVGALLKGEGLSQVSGGRDRRER